jgi:deoxyadenosine/deoxycytidine kinase
MNWQYLAIEGNIGAGKTTLATKLANDFEVSLILESFSENPFLPNFYRDQERYAFPLELSFLAERYHQLKEILSKPDLFKPRYIADYSLWKSLIFSRITLRDAEYQLFEQLFQIMMESLPKPDYMFYLHSDKQRLKENIKQRGRVYEQNIDHNYLHALQQGYLETLKTFSQIPVVVFDVTKADFLKNHSQYQQIVNFLTNMPEPGLHFVEIQ